MTDKELWNAAWTELTKTTDSYPTWKKKGFPATSHWAKAKNLGDQIGPTTPPPPPTASIKGSIVNGATLTGKITWTADNGPCVFTIDGSHTWEEGLAPYVYNGDGGTLDTATLGNGSHTFKVALKDGSAEHVVTATVQNATVPPPTGGKVAGVGLFRLAGTLSSASHVTDGTYDMIITDWETVGDAKGAPCPVFAYRNLGDANNAGEGWKPLFPGNPDPNQFVSECVALKRTYPFLSGIFMDNMNAWNSSAFLPFMKAIWPGLKQAGLGMMPNAMAKGDDGSADRAWYAQFAPYCTHIFTEYWELGRGGPLQCKKRLKGGNTYADFWEGWIQNPKAIHDLGKVWVCDSYQAANITYCQASFLLVAGPGDVYCASKAAHTPDGPDPYDTTWTKDMGAPLDPPVNPNGPYVRRFEHGTVSVDPVKGTATIT